MQQTSKARINRKPDAAAGVLIWSSRRQIVSMRFQVRISYTAANAATHSL